MVEESTEGTSKANVVERPNHPTGKNNKKNSGNSENPLGPKKNQGQFKKKNPCFVCGKPGHYARECRHRKERKDNATNAIEEDIIATISEINYVHGKLQGW